MAEKNGEGTLLRRWWHLAAFLWTVFLAGTVSAEGLRAAIFDIAPWGYRDGTGKVAGIEYDIITAISEEMGETITLELLPYNRMIRHLEMGVVDFAIFFRSEKSELAGEPLVKWGALEIIVIGRTKTTISRYEDLEKLDIAVRLGGFFDPRFDGDTRLKKRPVENYARAIRMLMNGRVDAVVGTAATLYYELKRQGVPLSEMGPPFHLSRKEDWLHFSRSSPNRDKKGQLTAAVEKLVAEGVFERIFSRYLPGQWRHH